MVSVPFVAKIKKQGKEIGRKFQVSFVLFVDVCDKGEDGDGKSGC